MTNYEYIKTRTPSQMAELLRKHISGNDGCPPATIMDAYTHCLSGERGCCQKCWFGWMRRERPQDEGDEYHVQQVVYCKDCRWGAVGDNGHKFVGCMHPRFYACIMAPDDFCKNGEPRPLPTEEMDELMKARKEKRRAAARAQDRIDYPEDYPDE